MQVECHTIMTKFTNKQTPRRWTYKSKDKSLSRDNQLTVVLLPERFRAMLRLRRSVKTESLLQSALGCSATIPLATTNVKY